MSDFRIDQITNQAGTAGPDIAGITTFSGSSGLLMPRGDTFRRSVIEDVVEEGLVLYLDAGNDVSYPGSGNKWFDLSNNGNTGTLVNGVGYSASNGGSLSFDGSDEYVQTINNVNISGDFSATLSVWVKFIELSTGFRCICMFGSVGTMEGFSIFSNIPAYGSGSIAIGFYGNNNAYISSIVTTNTWYNLTATKTPGAVSSSNTKLYINDILQTLVFDTSLTPNATNAVAYIGNDPANEVSNNMNVSNCSIYNRALTAAEISQNYNALKGRYGL